MDSEYPQAAHLTAQMSPLAPVSSLGRGVVGKGGVGWALRGRKMAVIQGIGRDGIQAPHAGTSEGHDASRVVGSAARTAQPQDVEAHLARVIAVIAQNVHLHRKQT